MRPLKVDGRLALRRLPVPAPPLAMVLTATLALLVTSHALDIPEDTAVAAVSSVQLAEFVGPARPVGPPLPVQIVRASRGLPFDPLAVGPFERELDSDDGFHTVAHIKEISRSLRYGETISELLVSLGVAPSQADRWIRATRNTYNLNRVYAGQEISLRLDQPTGKLLRMEVEVDPKTMLVAERSDDTIKASREPIPYTRSLRAVGGEIKHSLYVSAVSLRIPDKIISDVAEILGWDINFSRDLRPGASYRIVYEELTRERDDTTIAGRVLAVEIVNRGRTFEGFYFKNMDEGHVGYYDRNGRGLGRDFLRYPVAYSRVSSQFSNGRYHPVLKTRMPHYGVDFAAPTGTAVRAVADGQIMKSGWYGGNGRFVKIRHDSVYESGYAHLSRIATAANSGRKVKKGQVIGYVGSSGLATGPHLHFALYRRGKYIDPLRADLPRARAITGLSLESFKGEVETMDAAYAKAGHGVQTTVLAAAK